MWFIGIMSRIVLFGIFVILSLISLFIVKIRISKGLYWCFFIILVLVVVCRPDTMADYANYVNSYTFGSERFEPAYQMMYAVLHAMTLPYIFFFLLMACLTVGIKLSGIIKISDFPFLSLLIWVSQVLIIQDMVAIRAALASSILLWIIWYKSLGESLKMWTGILVAICCHYSAVVFLIIPFLSTDKPRKWLYIIGLCCAAGIAFIGFSLTDFLGLIALAVIENLNDMYENQSEANAFNLVVIARCLICLILWLKVDLLSSINKSLPMYLKVYTLGCILFFLTWKLVSVAFRFGELLWVTEIILYPYLMFIFGKKYKKIFKPIPVCVAVILFILNYNASLYWNPL